MIKGNGDGYLYQIICNKKCGVDVDKMDYLRRDSYHAGLPSFQSEYIILCSIIHENNIVFKSKARGDLTDLFDTRKRMHENVYQHHAVMKIDKIHYCMMKRLKDKLFTFGEQTDDYNVDTLIRSSSETSDLIESLDNRHLGHDCEYCDEYVIIRSIPKSGGISHIEFI